MIFILLVVFVLALALGDFYLLRRNKELKDDAEQHKIDSIALDSELERLEEKLNAIADSRDDYAELADERYAEIRRLREGNKMREQNYAAALKDRDDALMHLEETLVSTAAKYKVPDRISAEVGQDGVYYTLSYDAPEMAEVHPIPVTESSKA